MDIFQLFESTQLTFKQWRNDGHRRGYPKALKQDAVALLTHYRAQALSEALGVTVKSLARFKNKPLKVTFFIHQICHETSSAKACSRF